jgi:general secretion pathway protein G
MQWREGIAMDEQPGKFGQVARPAGPDARLVRRARRRGVECRPGFTLIEILIVVVILGILAAIVVPQFSNASHVARENMLKDELRYFRTQLAVYKAQHRDRGPGYLPNDRDAKADVMSKQMTGRTNERGDIAPPNTVSAQYRLGPYLQKIPRNPITQAEGVLIVSAPKNSKLRDFVRQEKEFGWLYNPETQEIAANTNEQDARGRYYADY